MILAAAILYLAAILSPDADKGTIGDQLRHAVKTAGCEDVVVEMSPTPPDAPMEMIARCRDERDAVHPSPKEN